MISPPGSDWVGKQQTAFSVKHSARGFVQGRKMREGCDSLMASRQPPGSRLQEEIEFGSLMRVLI
jgi:hypothetical protein